jgi:glutamate dehydrogenase
VLAACPKTPPARRVPEWLERDDPALRFTQTMLADLRSQKSLDYPTVSVAVRRLAQMAAAGQE